MTPVDYFDIRTTFTLRTNTTLSWLGLAWTFYNHQHDDPKPVRPILSSKPDLLDYTTCPSHPMYCGFSTIVMSLGLSVTSVLSEGIQTKELLTLQLLIRL